MILKILMWSIWCLFFVSIVFYIPGTKAAFKLSPTDIDSDWFIIVAITISVLTLFEALLTIIVRHFILVRPSMRGTFNIQTFQGRMRFLLVSILNWIIVDSVAFYGVVLYVMSDRIEFMYSFGLVGLSLLIIHSPRFSPYQSNFD